MDVDRPKQLTRLLDLIKRTTRQFPAASLRLQEAEAISRWKSAVGASIAKHTEVIKVESGKLWVAVEHPIWRTELHHRKHQILEKLNHALNYGDEVPIKDIFFVSKRG